MATLGCQLGKCNDPVEHPAWVTGAMDLQGSSGSKYNGQPLRRRAHGAASCRGAVSGSGPLADAIDVHNAAVDGGERRRT